MHMKQYMSGHSSEFNPLRVGLVLDSTLDVPDGVQQYILTVGRWLSARGHKVFYLVGETERTDIANVYSLSKNITVKFNQNRVNLPLFANRRRLSALLQSLELDVLHVQMPYHPYVAGHIVNAAPVSVKVVGTFHVVPASWLQSVGARGLQLLSKNSLRRFDRVMSVSTAAQDFARLVYGLETIVVPNAVNVRDFARQPRVDAVPHIVYLGRLVERKGCQHLLEALVELESLYTKPYRVTIGGKGPLSDKLRQFAQEHALRHVEFTGFVHELDKADLLASADIAVFPSTGGESFGISLIEAMAAGSRVVLGGDNVGYRTVLQEGPNLLVDPKDHRAFAERLCYFLNNQHARDEAATWARHAIARYDIETVGLQIEDAYRDSR